MPAPMTTARRPMRCAVDLGSAPLTSEGRSSFASLRDHPSPFMRAVLPLDGKAHGHALDARTIVYATLEREGRLCLNRKPGTRSVRVVISRRSGTKANTPF